MSEMITHAVSDIPDAERRSIENLLGCALDADQQVLVMAFSPIRVADDAVRRAAAQRIRERIAAIDRYQAANGIGICEADAAIDEAKSGLVDWLEECPTKGWFMPLPMESTDTLSTK